MPGSFQYTDSDLLLRVSKGDEYAFRILFTRYRNIVFSIAFKIIRINVVSEDTVQDIFLKIWLHREKLPEIKNFGAYLKTITCNHVYDALRKVACENAYRKDIAGLETACDSSTLSTLKFNELNKFVLEAVNALPVQQRKVYQLSRLNGMKYNEIAVHLKLARSTVNSHMVEALHFIKTRLKSNEIILFLVLLLKIV